MECGYKVKIKNNIVKDRSGKELLFDSDQLLDMWVEENFFLNPKNLERLRKYYGNKAVIFDTNEEAEAQSKALKILDDVTEKLEKRTDRISHNDLDYEYDADTDTFELASTSSYAYRRLVSVTAYINNTGNRFDADKASVTGSNDEEYAKWMKDEIRKKMYSEDKDSPHSKWVAEHGSSSASEVQFAGQVTELQNRTLEGFNRMKKYAQLVGEDIHHMMEVHANNKMGKETKLKPGYILSKKDQSDFMGKTKDIFDNICKRYNFSDEAVFLPEFTVCSDHIDNKAKRVLEERLKDKKDIEGVLGRIDLLVIDKGKAYVFDFKTTADKEVHDWQVGNGPTNEMCRLYGWWSSAKKLEAMEQVAMYLAILEQIGIEAGGGEVIPINIEYINYDGNDIIRDKGYPVGVKIENVGKNGKERLVATQEDGINNIKKLELDTSTESWDPETQSLKRSSRALIMHQYLP